MNRREAFIIGMIGVVFTGTAIVGGNSLTEAAGSGQQTYLCHATSSKSNPYVVIKIRQDKLSSNASAHIRKHTGPVGPTATGRWGDIVPPVAGFPAGRNYDAAGQAIWANRCKPVKAPNVATTTTVPPTTTAAPTTTSTTTGGVDSTGTTLTYESGAAPRS